MNQGWVCPRCGKVHAPFVRGCDCTPPTVTGSTIVVSEHESICICGGPTTTTGRCGMCGGKQGVRW
jgi:hypothetical protein